jgi:hypothetical protein
LGIPTPTARRWLAILALALPAWGAAADGSGAVVPVATGTPAGTAPGAASLVPGAPEPHAAEAAPVPSSPAASPAASAAEAAPAPAEARARADGNCPDAGSAVAVLTRKRELWLCSDGAPAQRFQVALGQRGLDKRRKGDGRTPLGTYSLGAPRPSGQFGIFIPIEYPTPEQARQGHTGSTVGIHGPPRGKAEPSYPSTAFDWTLGCVATGTDEDIEVIARFVRERQPVVVIR